MYKISDEVKKFIEKIMKNRREELTAGEKKLNFGENPKRGVPRRYAITITICNSDDATESHA